LSNVKAKEEELKSHLENKPAPPGSAKNIDSESNTKETARIGEIESALQDLKKQNETLISNLEAVNSELDQLNRITHEINSEHYRVKKFRTSLVDQLSS